MFILFNFCLQLTLQILALPFYPLVKYLEYKKFGEFHW